MTPAFHFAWEIQQANINIFDLHSNGIYFGQSVFHAMDSFFPFGLAARHLHDVHQQTAAHHDAVSQVLKFVVHGFDEFLTVHGGA